MGVRGLQTFMESHQQNSCSYNVSITELAKTYRDEHQREPVIIIDAQSCLHIWLIQTNSFSGLHMAGFIQVLLRFVDAFTRNGIKLVFCFGGNTVSKKRETWISRRFKDVKRVESVFNMLSNHIPVDRISMNNIITPHLSTFAMLIIRHYTDCQIFVSVDEADAEIIKFAYNKQCFAVLAQDSDFIIAQGDFYYFSSKHLNIENMTTLVYDGKKLAEFLEISTDKLPLLAALVGNDFIDFNDLEVFHRKIHRSSSIIMDVAEYIRKLPTDITGTDLLEHVAFSVFNDRTKCTSLIANMESYSVEYTTVDDVNREMDEWSKIINLARERHVNLRHSLVILGVVYYQIFECGASMDDFRFSQNLIPSCLLLRSLRRRLYGILFHDKLDREIIINEWVVESRTSCQKPIRVKPIFPRARHPGLIALWTDSPHVSSNIKWMLFLETVYNYVPHNFNHWTNLPDRLVLPVASLRYIMDTNTLHQYEIQALIMTILQCYLSFPKPTVAISDVYPDIRALHVSTLFFRTIYIFYSIMGACGYPIPWSSAACIFPFDGQIFQYHYQDAKYKSSFGNSPFGFSTLPYFDVVIAILLTNPENQYRNVCERKRTYYGPY